MIAFMCPDARSQWTCAVSNVGLGLTAELRPNGSEEKAAAFSLHCARMSWFGRSV